MRDLNMYNLNKKNNFPAFAITLTLKHVAIHLGNAGRHVRTNQFDWTKVKPQK